MNEKETAYRLLTENFKNKLNESSNNIREILPRMVQLSNNSRITQATAQAIADKLSKSEFHDFMIWLKLIERNK